VSYTTFACFDYYDYNCFNMSLDHLMCLLQEIALLLRNKRKLMLYIIASLLHTHVYRPGNNGYIIKYALCLTN
jgi:hypothetical protein